MSFPKFDIQPGQAIGPFRLGMTHGEFEQTVTEIGCEDFSPDGRPAYDEAFSNSLRIDYNLDTGQSNRLSIYWHPDCGCECYLNGKHISEFSAEELFSFLAGLDGGHHEYNQQAEYEFAKAGVMLFDLSTEHDYQHHGQRLVYGEFSVIPPQPETV